MFTVRTDGLRNDTIGRHHDSIRGRRIIPTIRLLDSETVAAAVPRHWPMDVQ